MASLVRVDSAPNFGGRGFFATADIATPGTHLCELNADFATVLHAPRLEDTCAGCFNAKRLEKTDEGETATESLRRCKGCHMVRYCDSTCQAEDWNRMHKRECRIFKKLAPSVLPASVRAVLHIVFRATSTEEADQEELGYLHQLICHLEEIECGGDEDLEKIEMTTRAIKRYSSTKMPEKDILKYAALCDTSSIGLTNVFGDKIGLSMIPYAAFCNHSCEPNAAVSFEGRKCIFRALRPIQKNEQVFIAYTDPTSPYWTRHSNMENLYYFNCRCRRCLADKSAQLRLEPHAQEIQAYTQLDMAAEQDGHFNNPRFALGGYWSAKGLLQPLRFRPVDQPYPSILDAIIPLLSRLGHYAIAFGFAAARRHVIDPQLHPSTAHPDRCVHSLVLAKLAVCLSSPPSSSPSPPQSGTTTPPQAASKPYPRYQYVEDIVNDAKFEFGLVAYTALMRLGPYYETEPESLLGAVRRRIIEIRREYMALYTTSMGLSVEQANEKLRKGRREEWKKLKKCAQLVLERDLEFGDDYY